MNDFQSYFHRIKKQDIYFLLGPQGSGTNLLSKLLIKVFNYEAVRDRSLIFNAAVKVHRNPSRENIKKQMNAVYNALYPGTFKKRFASAKHYHHQNKNYIGIKSFFDRIDVTTAEEFALFFYGYHAFINNRIGIAIKSDDIWENLEFLDQIFQHHKVILLTRDCRDNVLSVMNKDFGPRDILTGSRYIAERVFHYYRQFEKSPGRGIVVKYEDLLERPASVLRDLADHFSISLPEDVESRIAELKIRSTNIQKWRALSPEELLICETLCASELKKGGYKLQNTEFRHIPNQIVLKHQLRDILLRIPQRVKHFYRDIVSA